MKTKKSVRVFDAVNLTLLILFSLLILLPTLHVLFASVSDPVWVRGYKGLILWPRGVTLEGYKMVFGKSSIYRSILNSFLYMGVGVVINMVLTVVGAYVLSRRGLMLNKLFMVLVTVTMFFSGGIIPLYMLLGNLNLIDTIWAIVLPVAVSPWNMIILRTAFSGVPEGIMESARIDGAGELRLMAQIALPLVKATAAIVFLYYAVGHWNSWFSAMAFLRDRNKYPLQLIIRELLVINDTSSIIPGGMGSTEIMNASVLVKYCTAVVSMLPMLILFPFIQRYFTRGVLIGSIKS